MNNKMLLVFLVAASTFLAIETNAQNRRNDDQARRPNILDQFFGNTDPIFNPEQNRRFPNDRRVGNERRLPPGQAKKIYGGSARDYAPGQQKKWDNRNNRDRRYERDDRDRRYERDDRDRRYDRDEFKSKNNKQFKNKKKWKD